MVHLMDDCATGARLCVGMKDVPGTSNNETLRKKTYVRSRIRSPRTFDSVHKV